MLLFQLSYVNLINFLLVSNGMTASYFVLNFAEVLTKFSVEFDQSTFHHPDGCFQSSKTDLL